MNSNSVRVSFRDRRRSTGQVTARPRQATKQSRACGMLLPGRRGGHCTSGAASPRNSERLRSLYGTRQARGTGLLTNVHNLF